MEDIIIKERETRENIVKAINESNLPAFILKPILRDMLEQIERLEQQQYEIAMQNKSKEEKEKEEETKKKGEK